MNKQQAEGMVKKTPVVQAPVGFTGNALGIVHWNGLTSTVTLKIVNGVVVDQSDEHFPPDLGVLTTGRASRTLAKLCRSSDDPTSSES